MESFFTNKTLFVEFKEKQNQRADYAHGTSKTTEKFLKKSKGSFPILVSVLIIQFKNHKESTFSFSKNT